MYEQQQYGESENGRNGSFMLGLVCGAVVGAAMGMMWAPRSGAQLRRGLADQASRLKEKASEVYDRASDKMGDLMAKGREAGDELITQGRQAAEVGRQAFNRATTVATSTGTTSPPSASH